MYKVLIVDDEPVIAEGLKKIVDWEKYNCVVAGTASSGKEGLAMVEKCQPDILFTDIRMPGMDGLTMLAALRSEHNTDGVPGLRLCKTGPEPWCVQISGQALQDEGT